MLCRVIHAIAIGVLEIYYAMVEFAFLHFPIEALVINFLRKWPVIKNYSTIIKVF